MHISSYHFNDALTNSGIFPYVKKVKKMKSDADNYGTIKYIKKQYVIRWGLFLMTSVSNINFDYRL